jgi:hypothetical protein
MGDIPFVTYSLPHLHHPQQSRVELKLICIDYYLLSYLEVDGEKDVGSADS